MWPLLRGFSHTRGEIGGAVEAAEAMLLCHDAHHEVHSHLSGDLGESLFLALLVAVFGARVTELHLPSAIEEDGAVLMRVSDACWN